MSLVLKKKTLQVVVAVIVLCGVAPGHASAASSVKEGAKCSKVGLKVKASKTVSFVCTKYGTKTKVLKWKRVVTRSTKPKVSVTTTTVPSLSATSKIVIKSYSFVVANSIKKTDELTIANLDTVPHTVTFNPNGNDSSVVIEYSVKKSTDTGAAAAAASLFDVSVPGNSTAKLPPLDVGIYNFYCTIHTSMRGKLVIG
jgi:plastocyanin